MMDQGQIPSSAATVEQAMRDELAEGNGALAATQPILSMLLTNRDQSLFSDEVIARVRGMMAHVAQQVLLACAEAGLQGDPAALMDQAHEDLTQLLLGDVAILSHAHALTQEFALSEQLHRRSGIDGVLSPLLQELAANSDADLAASAMRVIAAQARFLQHMRRMELPLGELPGDLFHKALLLMQNLLDDDAIATTAGTALRAGYDEAEGRLAQLSRLVSALGPRAPRALVVDHAGPALFATALGMASAQDRNLVLLSFGENQLARLALALRAAGLGQGALEEQFIYLHPDALLPEGFDALTPARAATILADGRLERAG